MEIVEAALALKWHILFIVLFIVGALWYERKVLTRISHADKVNS